MVVRTGETVTSLSVGLVRLFPAIYGCCLANRFGALGVVYESESVFILDRPSLHLRSGHGVKRLLLAFLVFALADLLWLVFSLGGLLSTLLLFTLFALSDFLAGTTHRGR